MGKTGMDRAQFFRLLEVAALRDQAETDNLQFIRLPVSLQRLEEFNKLPSPLFLVKGFRDIA